MGFFSGYMEKKREHQAVMRETSGRVAKYELQEAKDKESVRQMKKETRELKYKPVREKAEVVARGFRNVRDNLKTNRQEKEARELRKYKAHGGKKGRVQAEDKYNPWKLGSGPNSEGSGSSAFSLGPGISNNGNKEALNLGGKKNKSPFVKE